LAALPTDRSPVELAFIGFAVAALESNFFSARYSRAIDGVAADPTAIGSGDFYLGNQRSIFG
jgi:hypothetical protein